MALFLCSSLALILTTIKAIVPDSTNNVIANNRILILSPV